MYRKIVAYNSRARQAYARGVGEKNRDEKITDLRDSYEISFWAKWTNFLKNEIYFDRNEISYSLLV